MQSLYLVTSALNQQPSPRLELAPIDIQRYMRRYAQGLCQKFYINPYEETLITWFSPVIKSNNVEAIAYWAYQQYLTSEHYAEFCLIAKSPYRDDAFKQSLEAECERHLNRSIH